MMPFGLLPYYRDLCPAYRHGWNVPEVGMFWAVATAHQRRGFAAEAAGAVLAYCFQELRLRRVVATSEHTNTASIGVMRRLGMRVEHNPGPDPFYLQVVGIADNPVAATGPT
jgi:RimJ/RimL family protein N-acetyltransferase